MHVRLVIVGGKANKSRVSVELPTVIGRSREADLTVAHPMISRKHCELYEVKGLAMIRDLGSLNGLFVGGTQVSEAALHPNAEFSVGPLTFRIEYAYVGEMATSPDATTVNETNGHPEAPSAPEEAERAGEEPDFEVVEPAQLAPPQGGPGVGDQPVDAGDEVPPSARPTIAPPDGQLPDFSAWGATDETEKAEDEQAAEAPTPPPAFFSAPPETKQPAPETGQVEPPKPAPPPSSTPPAAMQETAAFEPPELAETGEEPETPPGQQPAESADEGTGGSTTDRQVDADEAEGEGMFDLSLPPAPEADESDSTGPSEELDDFLKGLG